MMEKELYQKKMQAQLDEWKADVDNSGPAHRGPVQTRS